MVQDVSVYAHPNKPANMAAMANQKTVHKDGLKNDFLDTVGGLFATVLLIDLPARTSAREDIVTYHV